MAAAIGLMLCAAACGPSATKAFVVAMQPTINGCTIEEVDTSYKGAIILAECWGGLPTLCKSDPTNDECEPEFLGLATGSSQTTTQAVSTPVSALGGAAVTAAVPVSTAK